MILQAIILAGGKSRRFGQDKALALVEGVPMLVKAVNLLRSLKLEPVVMTEEGRNYSFLDCRIAKDSVPGKGPLGGIFSAMLMFPNTTLMVLTCDMPYVTRETLKTLMTNHTNEFQVTIYATPECGRQPFPGIYEPSLFTHILDRLSNDELSMQSLFYSLSRIKILSGSPETMDFTNINKVSCLQKRVLDA